MIRIIVTITTYKRPKMLARLLKQIEEQGKGYEVKVKVIDDNDPALDHCGREGFWQLISDALWFALGTNYDYWFHLPDDVTLRPDFFKTGIETWDGIRRADPLAVCLNPIKIKGPWQVQWVDFEPVLKTAHMGKGWNRMVWRIGWNDCCWITDHSLGIALGWRIHETTTWGPGWSSGVGRQISQRLYNLGFSMYGVTETLLDHGDHPSVMHPEERERKPNLTK